ncbi:MAG: hemolysin family protein [Atopostipes suicloacalis]|nr:hemolysin family protein [Atopostipes suicloacalis]MDN6731613.1 hemolysin family protein [Atopostipes suicloacalis]
MGISVILLVLLILLNGFFAGSEIALISVNERKLELLAEEGDRKAKLVLKLKYQPNRFLSTIQIGVSLASIFSGVFAAEAFANLLTDWIIVLVDLPFGAVKTISMIFITLMISYLMLVFGELVPKRLAMAKAEQFAYFAIYPLSILAVITAPIVKFLSISTDLSLKAMRINPEAIKEAITEEEIRRMVKDGEISSIEKEMIENIFRFDDMPVSEIMTHRTKISAISTDAQFDEILELIHREQFTRYPVYDGNIDNIIGIIHLRELLRHMQTREKDNFVIHDLLSSPYFVPDSKRADELFRELQMQKTHMGIVIDEYGGTAGLVTMENLIEEVMGEISDEYDEKKVPKIVSLSKDEYLVKGSCSLVDLEETLKIGLPVEKHATVNGFLLGHLGKIPSETDLINHQWTLPFNGYLFSIEAIDKKRIAQINVVKKRTGEHDNLFENKKL